MQHSGAASDLLSVTAEIKFPELICWHCDDIALSRLIIGQNSIIGLKNAYFSRKQPKVYRAHLLLCISDEDPSRVHFQHNDARLCVFI